MMLQVQQENPFKRDDQLRENRKRSSAMPVLEMMQPVEEQLDMSDQSLLVQVAQGNQHAFELLVHRYQGRLYRFARGYLSNEHAQDVVQGVFIQLYLSASQLCQKYSREMIAGGSLKSWLFRVTKNRCVDVQRQQRRQGELFFSELEYEETEECFLHELPDDEPLPETLAINHEMQEIVRAAIRTLPKPYSTILWLRYRDDQTFAAIADVLQIPFNTVKTYYYRGCQRLQRQLSCKM